MKMYTCERTFKTAFFNNGSVEHIEIKEGSSWYFVRNESQNRVVLCNNKIELVLAEKLLKEYFRQWGG